MEVTLADERALLLGAQLSMDQAEGRAWSNKIDAFGRLVKMTSLFSRPKDDDFELLYKEQRYQPFWHVICSSRYVYERSRQYKVTVSGPEVKSVTIEGLEYDASSGSLSLTGLEHCREEMRREVFIDGFTNQPDPSLANYFKFSSSEVPDEDLDDLTTETTIVVPPQARASAVVRDILIGMIKSVQADRILEDQINVERIDLYYRPVYAFHYRWLSKEREAIVEYDGVTGQVQTDGKTFQQYVGKIVDPEFLFDVGVETIDLLVPGGGLAIKLAKKGIEVAQGRKKES
ncbi:MAG: hypothetical protein JXA89_00120 [Anaerolineae bacterium]|nr:hypothetical protein [Anaerolineae bacterium]